MSLILYNVQRIQDAVFSLCKLVNLRWVYRIGFRPNKNKFVVIIIIIVVVVVVTYIFNDRLFFLSFVETWEV
jgi:hypothetical protein